METSSTKLTIGIYHVNVSFHSTSTIARAHACAAGIRRPYVISSYPLPRTYLYDGLWFQTERNRCPGKEVVIRGTPKGQFLRCICPSIRATSSGTRTSPSYISDNNLTGSVSGNGAFQGGHREVRWGIGSFDLPSYNIEITPFLGKTMTEKIIPLALVLQTLWMCGSSMQPASLADGKNSQSGHGVMRVGGGRVTSGIASTKQLYRYESNEGCYFRDIGSKNYSVLYDESSELCEKT
ncbi:hypothetical protein HPP92_026762 [Vanilla planifolia]|uniref:Uncharacterized protein n=1 Tax=Vanilla planifolia TaxID=51239 RepID=A0A835PE47_VANPL|nr:hypothetical protein HPP92_026762 [Vanilla planifolia]